LRPRNLPRRCGQRRAITCSTSGAGSADQPGGLPQNTGAEVTGVDLTPEFCLAARELNSLAGLIDRVSILHASALALPVPAETFDHAYSQAAIMNISDKRGLFREALRVLRPGGLLALSFVGRGAAGEPRYPLPWATTADISFLATVEETRTDLLATGLQIVSLRDSTAAVAEALAPILKLLETEGLPPLGEHVVTGENAKEWRINAMRSMAERRLSAIEGLARKAA